MPLLVSWMIVLSVFTALNLLFTFGAIRRLREHTKLLSKSSGADESGVMLAAGERIGDFSAAGSDGVRITRGSFAKPTLVGFFSPKCPACSERLPRFIALAEKMPERRAQVMAVIVGGDDDENAVLRATWTPWPPSSPMSSAARSYAPSASTATRPSPYSTRRAWCPAAASTPNRSRCPSRRERPPAA